MNINLMRLKIDYFVYHGTVSIARNDPKKADWPFRYTKNGQISDKNRTKMEEISGKTCDIVASAGVEISKLGLYLISRTLLRSFFRQFGIMMGPIY